MAKPHTNSMQQLGVIKNRADWCKGSNYTSAGRYQKGNNEDTFLDALLSEQWQSVTKSATYWQRSLQTFSIWRNVHSKNSWNGKS